ncbi:TPA: 50S ribosomal protein L21e [Candidatus Woesearchaeota archaeon]|nr:50S ribosomal protein L21e [Candidatus Woesearchaeota archaeon]
MATRIGGARRKTRQKYKKTYKLAGKISQRRFLQKLEAGDKVALSTEPAIQRGMYHRRFHGKTGTVGKKLGQCYEVTIRDHDKTKKLIVHPVHLKKVA